MLLIKIKFISQGAVCQNHIVTKLNDSTPKLRETNCQEIVVDTTAPFLAEDTRTENTVQKTVFAAISHIDGGKQSKIIFKNDVIRIA